MDVVVVCSGGNAHSLWLCDEANIVISGGNSWRCDEANIVISGGNSWRCDEANIVISGGNSWRCDEANIVISGGNSWRCPTYVESEQTSLNTSRVTWKQCSVSFRMAACRLWTSGSKATKQNASWMLPMVEMQGWGWAALEQCLWGWQRWQDSK